MDPSPVHDSPAADGALAALEAAPRPPQGSLKLLARTLAYTRPYLAWFGLSALFGVLFAAGRFGRAWLLKPLIDDAIDPRDFEMLWWLAWVGLGIAIVMPLAQFGRGYVSKYALGRTALDIRCALAAKLLRMPLRRHQVVNSGDTLTRTLLDANQAQLVNRLFYNEFLQSLIMIAIGFVTMLTISPQLTAMMLLAIPPIVGVLGFFSRRVRRSAGKRQAQLSEVTQRLGAILSGFKVIKAFRGEAGENAAFAREAHKLFRRHMKVIKQTMLSRSLVEFLNSGAGLALLFVGAWLVMSGTWGISKGDLLAFTVATATVYGPVKKISKGWPEMMAALASAQRFFEILDEPEDVSERAGARPFPGLREHVRFEAIRFSYDREPVLRDISFEARRGEVVAIVGPTGSGKTTLADLLLRFYEPESGRIAIDGTDLRDFTRESYLDRVAVVTQEPFLFDTTIRENILYGRPDAGEEAFQAAVRTAHVDEFVDALPDGYETQVGEFGLLLSGGQRQRITIARAILKDPDILVFDEATSALDAKTERIVQQALDALRGRRTVFVIAHRLSTIRGADRILVLERGRIVQQGRHDELIDQQGLYRELVSLQSDDDD